MRHSINKNLNLNIIFKEDSVKIGTCPKVREIKIIYKEETENPNLKPVSKSGPYVNSS